MWCVVSFFVAFACALCSELKNLQAYLNPPQGVVESAPPTRVKSIEERNAELYKEKEREKEREREREREKEREKEGSGMRRQRSGESQKEREKAADTDDSKGDKNVPRELRNLQPYLNPPDGGDPAPSAPTRSRTMSGAGHEAMATQILAGGKRKRESESAERTRSISRTRDESPEKDKDKDKDKDGDGKQKKKRQRRSEAELITMAANSMNSKDWITR